MSENQVKANEQEIGYLRIVFGILLVADISLISWVFSSAGEVPERMAGVAGILALSGILFVVDRRIRWLIDQIMRS